MHTLPGSGFSETTMKPPPHSNTSTWFQSYSSKWNKCRISMGVWIDLNKKIKVIAIHFAFCNIHCLLVDVCLCHLHWFNFQVHKVHIIRPILSHKHQSNVKNHNHLSYIIIQIKESSFFLQNDLKSTIVAINQIKLSFLHKQSALFFIVYVYILCTSHLVFDRRLSTISDLPHVWSAHSFFTTYFRQKIILKNTKINQRMTTNRKWTNKELKKSEKWRIENKSPCLSGHFVFNV